MSGSENGATQAWCRLCGGRTLVRVLSLKPTPPANAFVEAAHREHPQGCYPLDLLLCLGCGHVRLADVVDPRRLFEKGRSAVAAVPAAVASAEDCARRLLARFRPAQDALVVGIGSNDGTMLRRFKDAGLRPQGVEPAVDLARDAIDSGIPTFPGFFSPAIAARIEDERGRAAMVVAQDSFAQADDLDRFLEGIDLLLTRDGILVFEVPYLLDVVEGCGFDAICHENVHYHSVGPLIRFLHSRDLELVAVERLAIGGGRLRGIVQRLGGAHRRDPAVERLAEREAVVGLAGLEAYRVLGQRIAAVKRKLAEVLAEVCSAPRGAAGYGAPSAATTLCHQLGLGADVIDFVVDPSRWKQGRYTPGLHIPVLQPEALDQRRPAAAVLLNREIGKEVVARHPGFRDAGGRLIIPLPEPTVI